MKKYFYTLLALFFTTTFLWAQEATTEQSPTQPGMTSINIYGGISQPLGTYGKEIGRAELGPIFGAGIDHYFKGNKWGIGVDFRYFQHNMRAFEDTFHFDTGFKAMSYENDLNFKHYALTIGPSYKFAGSKMDIEAFIRGGVMFQNFPEYSEGLYVADLSGAGYNKALTPMYTDNPINNPKSWVGLAGLKATYKFNNVIGLFLQADYLRGLGNSFAGEQSKFRVTEHEVLQGITEREKIYYDRDGAHTNVYDYYSENKLITKETFVQAVNLSLGLRFSFGGKSSTTSGGISESGKSTAKDILVVVKDKKTGLALSGVKVNIKNVEGGDYISITNSNGESDRIEKATAGTYVISGDKNGIATTTVTIDASEFENKNVVIYKEIFHDDERFTLIGETIDCNTNQSISGINTMLTNTSNNSSAKQISDATGQFIYQLDADQSYNLVANQEGKYSQTEVISTKGLDRNKTLYVTLKLGVCPIEEGKSFVLKNIHYDFDKSNIRTDAAYILDNVVQIMKDNPTLKIELSSHTDSRGDDHYNMRLSERRAQAAVQYLISKGIAASRMQAKGYGESRLINHCGNNVNCSEAEHQENRRTEIKVLEY